MIRNGIIVSNNFLLTEGIRNCINQNEPDVVFAVSDRIDIKNIKQYSIIAIETSRLPDSPVVILERIRKANKDAVLLLFGQKSPPAELQAYINTFVGFSDSARLIQEKIKEAVNSANWGSSINPAADTVLSERESEVLRYVALGYINRDISEKLSISTHTVITHRKNITAKLGIKTIAGLAVYAVINGIISNEEMNA